ncbi:MAG TPA: autotransporter outer membrane beta-barrel domain-containing protein [Methylomirabilota bacterium]|nr:autotransporter outer membrane beta-barrel domain-containing protein [Methylomirabilota bacterium]
MTTRDGLAAWRLGVALAVSLLILPALAPPAQAQSFGDAFVNALTNSCQGTSGSWGPRLDAICTSSPGAAAATGALSIDTRGVGEEQRILKRLRERRDGGGSGGDETDGALGLRGLGLFVSSDYQSFEKGVTRFEPGYDRDTWGGAVGADYSFGGRAVVGLAVNYSHAAGTFSRHGGTFDTDAYGATLYASVLPAPNLFVDLLAGYTRRDYTVDRRYSFENANAAIPVAIAHGNTNGNEFKAGVNAGYDFVVGRFTAGPRVGFNFRENHIDSYAERGGTGLEVAYDRQHQTSFTSTLGAFGSMAISTGIGVLVPQATFEWVHELQDDQRVIYFHFVEDLGANRIRFQTDKPDRDYFNAGVGVVLVLPRGLSPFFNFREFFGYRSQSSHTFTVGLRFAF